MRNKNIKLITLLLSSLTTSIILASGLSTSIISLNDKTINTNILGNESIVPINANPTADASLFFEGSATGIIEYTTNTTFEPYTLTIVSSYNLVATDPTFKSSITIDEQNVSTTYTLTEIGDNAFLSCSGLSGKVVLPNTVNKIGDSSFSRCANIFSINIPSNVKEIPMNVFVYCTNLKNIEFASNSKLQAIGAAAFSNCTSLTEINLPSSVTTIGLLTFVGCTSLTEITILSSITYIGDYAFTYCPISNITLEEGNSTYNLVDLNNNGKMLVTKNENPDNTNWNGTAPTVGSLAYGDVDYTQYPSVTTIKEECFYGSNISKVKISNSITSIENSAFEKCTNLKNIEFDSNSQLESIGNDFVSVTQVSSFNIPSSVTFINDTAFAWAPITSFTVDANNQNYSVAKVSNGYILVSNTNGYWNGEPLVGALACGSFDLREYNLNNMYFSQYERNYGLFNGCGGVESVYLSNQLPDEFIQGFDGCMQLTSVYLPFTSQNEIDKYVNSFSFSTCIKLSTLYVPKGQIDLYSQNLSDLGISDQVEIKELIDPIPPEPIPSNNNLVLGLGLGLGLGIPVLAGAIGGTIYGVKKHKAKK